MFKTGCKLHAFRVNKSFSINLAPPAPEFLPDQCSVLNDKMILAWRPVKHGNPQGFVVEIDNGSGGNFTEVYSGNKTRCTVSGLQFDSTYRARVRAYSSAGESQTSDVVYLGTPDGKTVLACTMISLIDLLSVCHSPLSLHCSKLNSLEAQINGPTKGHQNNW